MTTYELNRKEYRRFMRRLRASDMNQFLKTGCDMGWYGHFIKPIPIPNIDVVLKRILKDMDQKYNI